MSETKPPTLSPPQRLVLNDLRILRQRLVALDPSLDADEELRFATLEGETNVLDELAREIRRSQDYGDIAGAIRARELECASRRRRFQGMADSCRAFVKEAMGILGIKRLPAPDFTAFVRPGEAELVIDEARLPGRYRHPGEPDRARIRQALEAGEEVPGASLGNAAPVLTVRTS